MQNFETLSTTDYCIKYIGHGLLYSILFAKQRINQIIQATVYLLLQVNGFNKFAIFDLPIYSTV